MSNKYDDLAANIISLLTDEILSASCSGKLYQDVRHVAHLDLLVLVVAFFASSIFCDTCFRYENADGFRSMWCEAALPRTNWDE